MYYAIICFCIIRFCNILSKLPQQKSHIQRKRENLSHSTHIIITQFDYAIYMVFFRMLQYSFCAFYIAASCLYFYQSALAVVSDNKIYSQATIFMIIIELSPYFGKIYKLFQATFSIKYQLFQVIF